MTAGAYFRQNINQLDVSAVVSDPAVVVGVRATIANVTLNATPAGSTDDCVLRWNAAAFENTGGIFSETTTAANGTIVEVNQAGIYHVNFMGNCTATNTVVLGIGFNSSAAMLNGDPLIAAGTGILASGAQTAPVATALSVGLSAAFVVTAAQAAATNGALVRFHGSNGSSATPGAGIAVAQVAYRITRIANFSG